MEFFYEHRILSLKTFQTFSRNLLYLVSDEDEGLISVEYLLLRHKKCFAAGLNLILKLYYTLYGGLVYVPQYI